MLKDDKKFMYLKRFRYHFLYFYKKLKIKIEEKNKRDFNLKKLLNDQEYLENLTDPMFERIKDKINDLTFVSAIEYLIKIGIIKIE